MGSSILHINSTTYLQQQQTNFHVQDFGSANTSPIITTCLPNSRYKDEHILLKEYPCISRHIVAIISVSLFIDLSNYTNMLHLLNSFSWSGYVENNVNISSKYLCSSDWIKTSLTCICHKLKFIFSSNFFASPNMYFLFTIRTTWCSLEQKKKKLKFFYMENYQLEKNQRSSKI